MNFIRKLPKIVIHFLIYILIIGSIMIFSVLLTKFGPSESIYYDSSWADSEAYVPETNITYNILFDQHSHTKYSDGKLTVRQNIEWHIAMGYTAFAITDHNTLRNSEEISQLAEEYKNEIIVIQGMEWTTKRIHLNFLDITEWKNNIPINPTDSEIKEVISEVHRQNGIVTANHLIFTKQIAGDNMPTREELLSWGVDSIEVINGRSFDESSYKFCIENNESIGMLTGTDMHSPDVNEGGRVYAWTALNSTNFTRDAVMDALRAHNTSIIINYEGVENQGFHKKNKAYPFLYPFYELGNGLIHFYLRHDKGYSPFVRIVVIVYITYSFGLFILIEIGLSVRKSLTYRRRKKKSN